MFYTVTMCSWPLGPISNLQRQRVKIVAVVDKSDPTRCRAPLQRSYVCGGPFLRRRWHARN